MKVEIEIEWETIKKFVIFNLNLSKFIFTDSCINFYAFLLFFSFDS